MAEARRSSVSPGSSQSARWRSVSDQFLTEAIRSVESTAGRRLASCCGTTEACAAERGLTPSASAPVAVSRSSMHRTRTGQRQGRELAAAELKTGRSWLKFAPGGAPCTRRRLSDDLAELAAACSQLMANTSEEIAEQTVSTSASYGSEFRDERVDSHYQRRDRRTTRGSAARPTAGAQA